MLKVIENGREAIDLAEQIEAVVEGFEVGATGAFVEGINKKSTPVQIVLKAKEGHESKVGTTEVLDRINSFMSVHYYNKYEVLWYDLLEQNEAELLGFLQSEGMHPNPQSIYGRIVELTKWAEGVKVNG